MLMLTKENILKMKTVDEIQAAVNDFIEEHKDEVKAYTVKNYTINGQKAYSWEHLHEMMMANFEFDCGWLKLYFLDDELNKHVEKLTRKDWGYTDGSFIIHVLPVQSTRMMSVGFEFIQELLKDAYQLDVRTYVHLD